MSEFKIGFERVIGAIADEVQETALKERQFNERRLDELLDEYLAEARRQIRATWVGMKE